MLVSHLVFGLLLPPSLRVIQVFLLSLQYFGPFSKHVGAILLPPCRTGLGNAAQKEDMPLSLSPCLLQSSFSFQPREFVSGQQMGVPWIDPNGYFRVRAAAQGPRWVYFKARRVAKVKCTGEKDGGREAAGTVRKHTEVCSSRTSSTLFKKPKEGARNVA